MKHVSIVLSILFAHVFAASAHAATISITPDRGPVGTIVQFQGTAPECADEVAHDAEVFLLVGNFAGGEAINPRVLVEVDEAGAFTGSWPMPDPTASSAHVPGVSTFPVSVRCIDAAGAHEGGDITPSPATFTFLEDDACTRLATTGSEAPSMEALLGAVGACLDVVLRGTRFADALRGNLRANVLDGFAGNDVLHGLAGNDTMRGGVGSDRLFGGAGSDVLAGGPGTDTLHGGPGRDTCIVNPGDVARACERVRRLRR